MSKKASKKGKTKQPVHTEDLEPWIEELKTLVINDDQWHCNVTLLMDTNSLNMCCVSSFNDVFINDENVRPHIRVISNVGLAINTLQNSYNFASQKDATMSAYIKLCNESLKFCAMDGFALNTPAQILASLIKYSLLELKTKTCAEVLLRQEYVQKKKKIQDESLTQLENFIKRTPSSKKEKVKSSPKKATKSGGKAALDKFTTLRKRNETFFDLETVNDEGPGGPQLYVILTGFRQPDLPPELLKLQIPLLAVIKLHDFIDDTGAVISKKNSKFLSSVLSLVSPKTKIKQRRYSNAQEESYLYDLSLSEFWDRLLFILYSKDNIPLFKNTMFLQFYPYISSETLVKYHNLKSSNEMYEQIVGPELQKSIYEQLCFLQYDIQDLKRQHKTYIDNLKIRDVEEKNKFNVNDMQFYLSIMDSVPSELINVPFILDAILLQIEFSSNVEPTAAKDSISVSEDDRKFSKLDTGKESKLSSNLKSLDKKYDLFNHEEISPNEFVLAPAVLVEGDEIGIKTYWCEQKSSVKEVTCKMLSCFWDSVFQRRLLFYDNIFNSKIKDNDSDLFKMLKSTGDLTLLEKLYNMPCDHHKIVFEDKVYTFCVDNYDDDMKDKSREFNKEMHINFSNGAFTKRNHFSDPSEGYFMGQTFDDHGYCFIEMTKDILLQNLFKCFESFNCFDLQQDYFQDKIFLRFHNRKTCLENEYFIGTLRTPTALRDFYDYTVDEEFYWLNEKELSYIKSLLKIESNLLDHELQHLYHLEYKAHLKAQKICSNTNFLSPDSIKFKNQPTTERFSTASVLSEQSHQISEEHFENEFLEAFDIYLPNRVQFSERRQEFVLSTHSKLLIKNLSRLYVDDSLFLQVSIYGHTLYFFVPIVKSSGIHFHVLHERGFVFYFKKNVINLEPPNHHSEDVSENKTEKETKPLEKILKHVKYDLSLSLPNSLYLQVVNPPQISLYVKQHYLSKILQSSEVRNEEFRCCLLDGKLVKFLDDDSVVIYYPNSTIYYCKKISYESTVVEDVLSVVHKLSVEEKPQPPNKSKLSGKAHKASKSEKVHKDDTGVEVPEPKPKLESNLITVVDSYECTLTTGQRISVDDKNRIELESLFCKTYSDILKGVIITERYDGTTLTHTFEGELIVNFPDGSRITTFSRFSKNEIFIDLTESTETNTNSEVGSETNESKYVDDNLSSINHSNQSLYLPEGFILIEVDHLIEHPNFASISVDRCAENLIIDLPSNVHISLSSEGFYSMNFDNTAELLVRDEELVFRETSKQRLPEFIIYFNNLVQDFSSCHKCNKIPRESCGGNFCKVLSCMDYFGNILEVDCVGDIHLESANSITNFCKCSKVNNDRIFIINNHFNGLEILPPSTLDDWLKEAKIDKNCVFHHYGSTDHHVLLLLKPLTQNEHDKWLKDFKQVKFFPRFGLPSTYNDKDSWFNPFPKKKFTNKLEIPKAFLVNLINRVNCNIHLQKQSFLKNKMDGDEVRINKHAEMCIILYEQGSVKFFKANKRFTEFVQIDIIGRILSRARKRVIQRLEYRNTKEYELILRKRILLPYFSSAQGSVHELLLEMISSVVGGSFTVEEGSKLEKLLKLPLDRLTDADLDFIHDKIAEFTVGSICSCLTNKMACKLRILLLAGRTLHGLISDMISVFFLYAENMKRRKLAEDERRKLESTLLKELLMRPLYLLTENDFQIVHDRLKTLPYCSCSVSPEKCKLKVLLLASAVLNDFFPNLDSVLKSSAFNVAV